MSRGVGRLPLKIGYVHPRGHKHHFFQPKSELSQVQKREDQDCILAFIQHNSKFLNTIHHFLSPSSIINPAIDLPISHKISGGPQFDTSFFSAEFWVKFSVSLEVKKSLCDLCEVKWRIFRTKNLRFLIKGMYRQDVDKAW